MTGAAFVPVRSLLLSLSALTLVVERVRRLLQRHFADVAGAELPCPVLVVPAMVVMVSLVVEHIQSLLHLVLIEILQVFLNVDEFLPLGLLPY